MKLGENIYRLRTERNMSQEDLADALEVSRQSVSKWENQSSTPELDKLLRLSHIFDVSLDELVNGESNPKLPPETAPEQPPEASQPGPEAAKPAHDMTETLLRAAVVLLAIGFAMIFNGFVLGYFSQPLQKIAFFCGMLFLVGSGICWIFLLG